MHTLHFFFKIQPLKFLGRKMGSVWTIKFKPGGEAKLEGNVRLQVHYYEDGNVQLVTNFNKSSSVKTPSDAKGLADAVVKQISKLEMEYQNAVEHSYQTMGDTTFKALRRVLPITRERIKWEKIRNYRIGSEVARV